MIKNNHMVELSVELDRTHMQLFSKILDTLRAFVPECHLNMTDHGVSFTNLDDTHTVVVMGLLNKGFFSKYNMVCDDKTPIPTSKGPCIQQGVATPRFSVDLEQLYKIMKSSATLANLKINPLKIEIALTDATQRRKTLFNLDTYQNNDDWNDLSTDIQTNIDEYPYQIDIRNVDFKEILTSIKIFKTEIVTLQLQQDLLIFTYGEHRVEYKLEPPESDRILEDDELLKNNTSSVTVHLGTDRLLNLGRALSISSYTKICLSSGFHPVYFCFRVEDDPHNQLVVALSPRDN